MEMHHCKLCREVKPFDQFVKVLRSGPLESWNLRYCKDCAHKQYLKRYEDPKKRKNQNKASNNWKAENPERHAQLAVEYRKRHPEKTIAQNRLNYAVRKGLIKRLPCEVCGSAERVHAHHHSYAPEDWYNVKWLCHVCHKLEHG